MRSLERRLQLTLGACLLVGAFLIWLAGDRLLEGTVREMAASRLEQDATALLAALEFDATGAPAWQHLDPAFYGAFSGHYFVLRTADGTHYPSRSLWDEDLPVPPVAVGETVQLRVAGPRGQRLLARVAGYRKADRDFTLAVFEDLAAADRYRARLSLGVALFALGGVLALALALRLVLRAALRPLDAVRADLGALEEGRTERLPEHVPAEIVPLVREVNRLLGLLARRAARSRHALGDLAHALKQPLQMLQQQLGAEALGPSELAAARAQLARITALIQRELKRARLAGGAPPAQRYVASEQLPDLVATLKQLHRSRNLAIVTRIGSEVPPFGEAEDVQEMLGNLLDNACKWARRRVEIELTGRNPVEIVVRDDGPGLEPAALADVTRRGVRLDEATAGHGLGLAIVADIVDAYEGRLELGRDPALGGLVVRVTLPAGRA